SDNDTGPSLPIGGSPARSRARMQIIGTPCTIGYRLPPGWLTRSQASRPAIKPKVSRPIGSWRCPAHWFGRGKVPTEVVGGTDQECVTSIFRPDWRADCRRVKG